MAFGLRPTDTMFIDQYQMHFEEAKKFVLKRLRDELDKRLHYHGVHHTLDVIEAAARLAALEGIEGKELILLQTAALYHDSGFLFCYKGHEQESAEFAKQTLPTFGYSGKEIRTIQDCILATEVPQRPKSLLAEILCDADLDYLGRDDFESISKTLFDEWKDYNILDSELDWFRLQIKFLENHFFHTNAALKLRNKHKLKNLERVKMQYNTLKANVA